MIHLRNLGYEHLQNTWSSWWNCMAWSKSALLLELSWLAYSLLYFAPLAKSLVDKKVPDVGNIAKVFGKNTTGQGHEFLKHMFKLQFCRHTTWPIFTKRQFHGMVVNYMSADWLSMSKATRWKVGISNNQNHFKLLPAVANLEVFITCQQFGNYNKLSTALTAFTRCRKL